MADRSAPERVSNGITIHPMGRSKRRRRKHNTRISREFAGQPKAGEGVTTKALFRFRSRTRGSTNLDFTPHPITEEKDLGR